MNGELIVFWFPIGFYFLLWLSPSRMRLHAHAHRPAAVVDADGRLLPATSLERGAEGGPLLIAICERLFQSSTLGGSEAAAGGAHGARR